MSATPGWFGNGLFAWLHLPEDGQARAGVVLCPPVGYEYAATHRTFRTLAERLAERGVAALRLDYHGTGDSAGDDTDPGRVPAWVASIDAAMDALRDAGAPAIGVVGMRLGGLLASECVARRDDVDALVLWDPVWSGKAYLRQARTLHLLATDAPAAEDDPDGGMWVTGTRFTGETVGDLKGRTLADLSSSRARTLVLRRTDQTVIGARTDGLPVATEEADATDQHRLLDTASSAAVPPRETIDRVAAWLDGAFGGEPRTVEPFTAPQTATERVVSIPPLGLFGVESAGGARPTVVFLNGGTDHHIGPNRIWVDWGRRLAADGFRVARVDVSGLGDSPVRDGQPVGRSYPRHAVDDVQAIAAHYGQVILVGLCSGSRNSLSAAAAGVPGVIGVCAFGPSLHLPDEILWDISPEEPIARGDEYRRYRSNVLRRLPKPLWRAVHTARPGRSRLALPARAVANGVPVFLSYGSDEWCLLRLRETSAWHIDHLRRDPRFTFVEIPGLDHPLMAPGPRRQLLEQATGWLRTLRATRDDVEGVDVADVGAAVLRS